MRSDSVKNMSAYADQNHAPSLTDVRLELSDSLFLKLENGHDNPGSLSYHDRSILQKFKFSWNPFYGVLKILLRSPQVILLQFQILVICLFQNLLFIRKF